MKLIGASAIITCDADFAVIENGGILFDEKIIKIGNFDELRQKHADIESRFYESCVILPAFINAHIHLEFSQNISSLNYGNFGQWLDSVMSNRESLMRDSKIAMKQAIRETLESGISTIGAISSNGEDIEILKNSPLRVVLFNEIMGTSEEFLEKTKKFFDERLNKTISLKSDFFKPAIALHSPYSLHFELASHAISRAMKEKLLVSAHFLESKEELTWLEYKKGYFAEFFEKFFNKTDAKPFYSKQSFIELFKKCETLFVHCLFLNNDDFASIAKLKNLDIVSCPRSNRLLNNRYFDFFKAKDYKFPLIIATDGKSSNNSISLLDEARCALFAYEKFNIEHLAREILMGITANPARRMGFNNGILAKNKASDFAIFKLSDLRINSQLALNFILHAKKVNDLYIAGKRIDFEND